MDNVDDKAFRGCPFSPGCRGNKIAICRICLRCEEWKS